MPSERKKMQKVKKSDAGGRAFSYAQFIYRVLYRVLYSINAIYDIIASCITCCIEDGFCYIMAQRLYS